MYVKGIFEVGGQFHINSSIVSKNGEFDARAADGQQVRFRIGTGTTMLINGSYTTFYAPVAVRPYVDNTASLGQSTNRFTNVFASGGVINTSDRRHKTSILPINDAVLDAWSEVNYQQFRYIDAVKEKGEEARVHIGVIAQEIEEAFSRHGLDAFDYGLLCYDEWDDIFEKDENGNDILVREKDSLYGVRSNECLMLEAALLRRELNKR